MQSVLCICAQEIVLPPRVREHHHVIVAFNMFVVGIGVATIAAVAVAVV